MTTIILVRHGENDWVKKKRLAGWIPGVHLNENGRLFFTAFAEKDVPDMTVNPANYRNIEWKSALHCVRYNVDSLQALLVQCGFQVDEFVYEQETNGQSAFYVSVAA